MPMFVLCHLLLTFTVIASCVELAASLCRCSVDFLVLGDACEEILLPPEETFLAYDFILHTIVALDFCITTAA